MRGPVDESAFAARVASENSKMVDVDNQTLQRHGAGSAPCLCEVSGPTASIIEFSDATLAANALRFFGGLTHEFSLALVHSIRRRNRIELLLTSVRDRYGWI